ncbi:MAG: hypothetical protein ACLP01_10720 [Solirubrobacteraceae bacterium]
MTTARGTAGESLPLADLVTRTITEESQLRAIIGAVIIDDRELLVPCAIEGKVPRLGILVSIEQAFTQCPKALRRSDLWNPEHHIDRSQLPSSGAIMRSLTDPAFDADAYDRARAERYARREGMY